MELRAATPAFWKHSLQQDSSKWKQNKNNNPPQSTTKNKHLNLWMTKYHKKKFWPHNFLLKSANS